MDLFFSIVISKEDQISEEGAEGNGLLLKTFMRKRSYFL
jgi:hypothetical protein